MLYKEWCNYLEENYLRRLYKLKEFPGKLSFLCKHYENSMPRPLIYLSKVMKIQMRFYIIKEKLLKGEDINFFSQAEANSSMSNTSIISNTDNILNSLKLSFLKENSNPNKSNLMISKSPFKKRIGQPNEYLEEKLPDNQKFKEYLENNPKPKLRSSLLVSNRRMKSKASEQSIQNIFKQLPDFLTPRRTSFSIIHNETNEPTFELSDEKKPNLKQSSYTIFKKDLTKRMIKKKTPHKFEILEDQTTEMNIKKQKARASLTQESNKKRQTRDKVEMKAFQTEQQIPILRDFPPDFPFPNKFKKFKIEKNKSKISQQSQFLIEPQIVPRPTISKMPIHKRTKSQQVCDTRATSVRQSFMLPLLGSNFFKSGSSSKNLTSPIHNKKLKSSRGTSTDPKNIKVQHKNLAMTERNTNRELIDASYHAAPKQISHRHSNSNAFRKDSFKPVSKEKNRQAVSQKSKMSQTSPIYVNIFAPQLPSARIYFQSENEEQALKNKRTNINKIFSLGKQQPLLQKLFKEEKPEKLNKIKSTFQPKIFRERRVSVPRRSATETALPSHRKTRSQSKTLGPKLEMLQSERKLALPPEKIHVSNSGAAFKNALFAVPKSKVQEERMIAEKVKAEKLKQRTEKFSLKCSGVNKIPDFLSQRKKIDDRR